MIRVLGFRVWGLGFREVFEFRDLGLVFRVGEVLEFRGKCSDIAAASMSQAPALPKPPCRFRALIAQAIATCCYYFKKTSTANLEPLNPINPITRRTVETLKTL